jgi:hypothetical protein
LNIEQNINHQNLELWNELNDHFEFRLIYSPSEYSWRVNTENNPIEIYTSSKTPNIPAFTHELLHVYLELKGMSTPKDLLNSIYGNCSFKVLTQNALIARIQNYCSHLKMYPYFERMGFHEGLFLANPIRLSKLSYFILKLRFANKNIKTWPITDFIGHSVALLNDVDSANIIHTEKSILKLRKLKPSLFKIIEDFIIYWKSAETFNLALFFSGFDKELNEWLIENHYCR